MKPRVLVPVAGAVALLALLVSLSIATAGTEKPAKLTSAAAIVPPAVPNAPAIKAKYGGQTITFIGDNAVGASHTRDIRLAAKFTAQTGIKVKVIPHPAASDAAYAQLARAFSSDSSSIDVAMLDVVWPGAFAPFLVDLKPALGAQAKLHAQGIIQNDTVDGKLVAMPWFGDFGILYYRTDLLKKYGYSAPPKTWTELGQMAKKIQDGEQATNSNFYGFVWQGNAYEGLTCDALEWIASSGGGNIIRNGVVTINNPKAAGILDMVRGWVGTIAPRGVTSYQEEDARNAFDNGNAAFMRNWPYAYAASKGTAVDGKFAVTVLPHENGAVSVGTVGGWQVAVSKYSKHQQAAIEWVRYLTSPVVERYDAIFNTNVPTIPSVAKRPRGRQGQPVSAAGDRDGGTCDTPCELPEDALRPGLADHLPGHQPDRNGAPASSVLPGIAAGLKPLIK